MRHLSKQMIFFSGSFVKTYSDLVFIRISIASWFKCVRSLLRNKFQYFLGWSKHFSWGYGASWSRSHVWYYCFSLEKAQFTSLQTKPKIQSVSKGFSILGWKYIDYLFEGTPLLQEIIWFYGIWILSQNGITPYGNNWLPGRAVSVASLWEGRQILPVGMIILGVFPLR